MKSYLVFAIISLVTITGLGAQSFTLRGKLSDNITNESLIGGTVALYKMPDSTFVQGVASDANGNFNIPSLAQGFYKMRIQYLGYETIVRPLRLDSDKNLGEIKMSMSAELLKTAEIEGTQIRTAIKGDTVEMNADAFKVNPDANLEDLVKKMPGMQVENGTIKAGGEQVQKVLIDGKEFFGDDVSMALKNLPAEVVDKIQYFDKMSDQAQFSGFDDGNSRRTINVLTKRGVKEAQFGKIYGGGGTNERYAAGMNLNFFKENRRISVLGQSNNINQQNFANEDLLGLSGGSGGGGGGGGRGRMMGMVPGATDPSNFMVGQSNGINTTHSFGLSYSDSLSKAIKLSGSYFFNNSYNTTEKSIGRESYLNDTSSQIYSETSKSWSNNLNHRLNLRMEINLDSNNSIIYTPKISWQASQSNTNLFGSTRLNSSNLLSNTATETPSNNVGYAMGQNILYRHKMKKEGRTISIVLNSDNNERSGVNDQISTNEFFAQDTSILIQQRGDNYTTSATYSANIMYTEPIGKSTQLFLNYRPSLMNSISLRETNRFNAIDSEYNRLDSLLSNRFENRLATQTAGGGFRFRGKKFFSVVNLNAQYVELEGIQTFPQTTKITKTFFNVIPFVMLNYKFSSSSNLRVFYRSNTNAPSASQLQNVLNNSNPLQLSIGNSELKQEFNQTLTTRFSKTNPLTSRSIFFNISGGLTNNYIGNSTIIALADTVLPDGIRLRSGSQLSKPVNLEGRYSLNSLLTYSLPVKWIKSTVNIQAGLNYSLTPGLINNVRNETNNFGYTGGLVIASNISKEIDFTISYNGSLNIVENSLQPQLNNNFIIHSAALKGNWLPWKGLVITSEATYSRFEGLEAAFNQQFILWNAGIGYKFLKNRAGELKITGFDILNQNTSISRAVTETYVEDTSTRILNRYAMLTFTYTFRKFNGIKAPEVSSDSPHGGQGGPGSGGRPPMGH
jgi:hypothetical protein